MSGQSNVSDRSFMPVTAQASSKRGPSGLEIQNPFGDG